jgi:hypothetical protein
MNDGKITNLQLGQQNESSLAKSPDPEDLPLAGLS